MVNEGLQAENQNFRSLDDGFLCIRLLSQHKYARRTKIGLYATNLPEPGI